MMAPGVIESVYRRSVLIPELEVIFKEILTGIGIDQMELIGIGKMELTPCLKCRLNFEIKLYQFDD